MSKKDQELDIKRLTVGKRCRYTSKKHEGTGEIANVYSVTKGTFVVVNDKTNFRYVTVRPSQIKLF